MSPSRSPRRSLLATPPGPLVALALVALALVFATIVPGAATAAPVPQDDAAVDASLLSTLEYRFIGPMRGGRSTAVTGIRGSRDTFLMGTTGGGVWRTDDAGLNWRNVSDGFLGVGSVGAVAVAPSDPNVVYVGTGSSCIRGNASAGDGVYRSTDGGDTWKHVGLGDSGVIARIEVHPQDPDLVYLAAFGHPFGPNEERGVYRSRDGGDTWEQLLHVSPEVGAIDLSMNPGNPREMYAAFWRFERRPWTYVDASDDGGIFKSSDGGDTWKKLAGGLPEGETGRIGVDVSPAEPDRVYALVSANPDGGLYRSDDAGETWKRVNRDRNLRQRHWYYSHVTADPQDSDTVYVMNVNLWRSVDGGATVESLRPNHGDTHDLWIHPDDSDLMIVADDGGGEVSLNAGATWSSIYNQPTAEIYRVTVDEQFPYRVYGAQQDNSTLSLDSRGRGGFQDWYTVGGCESGHIAVDPRDPDIVYAGCYIGEISRFDRSTGERRPISVYPVLVDGVAPVDLEHRFQWNAPILVSRHDPGVLYHTSNTVNRTRDEGRTWEVISPDLTRDDPETQVHPGGPLQHDHTSVEVFNTVFALAESPHEAGVLWAGSDDGRVHVTRNDGATWLDVTPPGMPVNGTVNSIDVSAHRPGKVTVAVHRYRLDDTTPYVWQTEDGGESWERIADGANGIPDGHPVRVVREDPDREGLLYAGTERGLFVSFDDGGAWQSLQANLPVTPVTDLLVHRQDLVVSTQGRGFWILDDLTALHQLAGDELATSPRLLRPRPAIRAAGSGSRPAHIHYALPEGHDAEVTLEVVDGDGATVRSWSSSADGTERLEAKPGMNRQVWDLRHLDPELVDDAIIYLGYSSGPVAVPGTYTARLHAGDTVLEQPLEVAADPRRDDVSVADLQQSFAMQVELADLLGRSHAAIRTLRSIRSQATDVTERAEAAEVDGAARLRELADRIAERSSQIENRLIQTKAEARQDPINFPPQLDTQIGYLYRYVVGTYGAPNEPARVRFADLVQMLAAEEAAVRELVESDVAELNRTVRELGLAGVIVR